MDALDAGDGGERSSDHASLAGVFPVILRHGQQVAAIRFLYDCSTGKIRYYTSSIPSEIASLPEFENAASELFRHSLPVEPMRARKLARGVSAKSHGEDQAFRLPMEKPARLLPAVPGAVLGPVARTLAAAAPSQAPPPAELGKANEFQRSVRIEIGPRARSVLLACIFTLAIVTLAALGIYAYLQAVQDPGVMHHRMQIEEMRLREGR